MSSWGCPHEFDGLCQRVNGAICKPGMRGCVLQGKVEFKDGVVPAPRWPDGSTRGRPRKTDEPKSK
jgi:hypothetical protein